LVLLFRRLAWVLGFAMGPYGCMERTWKPFNPLLGETFEVDLDNGVRFFAEQVPLKSAALITISSATAFLVYPQDSRPTRPRIPKRRVCDCRADQRLSCCALLQRRTAFLTLITPQCYVQVSHHPPIGVGHGENDNWTYDIVSAPSTKFLGNSVEIYPIGAAPLLYLDGSCPLRVAARSSWSLTHIVGRARIFTAYCQVAYALFRSRC